jgi:hypothetical protein
MARACLQNLFNQPVSGFVYPFDRFVDAVAQPVRNVGHICARTNCAAASGVGTQDAMAAAPSCHFMAPDFWRRFDHARSTGDFWFCGHSSEFVSEAM